jgi:release factor glutamine methyltransferase
MNKSFIEHLIQACTRPINEPVFLEGYAGVLEGVARPATFDVNGLTIDAPSGVYSPHGTSSTRFMLDHFFALGLDRSAGRVLEMGCGAGAIALHAARFGSIVSACDIDPVAVDATRRNAEQNGLNVDVRQSDLFSAFADDEQYDVIIFNQPFFHLNREIGEHERTLSDFGGRLHEKFMAGARKHLAPGGRLVVAYSNCSNIAILNQPGWNMEVRAFDFDAGSDYIRALFHATPV